MILSILKEGDDNRNSKISLKMIRLIITLSVIVSVWLLPLPRSYGCIDIEVSGITKRYVKRHSFFAVVNVEKRPYHFDWLVVPPPEVKKLYEELLWGINFDNRKPRALYREFLFSVKRNATSVLAFEALWIREGKVSPSTDKEFSIKSLLAEIRVQRDNEFDRE